MQNFKHSVELLNDKKIHNEKELIKILLENRQIKNINNFLNPLHPSEYIKTDEHFSKLFDKHVIPAVEAILKSINKNKPIIIHGDYDVDGQTATAILWKTIHDELGYKNVIPYIPNRFSEGYGLSIDSINGIIATISTKTKGRPLIVTVDCGIVSIDAVEYAKKSGFDIIITDHHSPGDKLPNANIIVHTTQATGAGIAWIVSRQLLGGLEDFRETLKNNPQTEWRGRFEKALENPVPPNKYLDLAALGTVCDLQPLTGFNRAIVKFGLVEINKNPSLGINALKKVCNIDKEIETYHVGWQLGPRLNAAGRLETAMDSLRLLCTNSTKQATKLAQTLNGINSTRQDKTQTDLNFATLKVDKLSDIPNIIITHSESYHEGIIGLVAGKLVQTYNRPSIAISINEKIAKGSARSIKGISIIDELRKFEDLFESIGGHEMAAGFSIKSEKIENLKLKLAKVQFKDQEIFNKKITVDCELPHEMINQKTYDEIKKLKPFGVGNHEPSFLTRKLKVINVQKMGRINDHLKIFLENDKGNKLTGVGFGMADYYPSLVDVSSVNLIYKLSINEWQGKKTLNLILKDICNDNNCHPIIISKCQQ